MTKTKKASGVSVTVPGKPVGRLIDVVAGIFSPFAEKGRLRADQIRLQREDVLIEIAKKAKERLAIEKQPIKAIPNKILVPLLEAASNEEIEDTYMVDMWSKLLASAATDAKVEPRYISILKELQGKQAQTLHSLATHRWQDFENPLEMLRVVNLDGGPFLARRQLELIILSNSNKMVSVYSAIAKAIMDQFNRPGCCVLAILQLQGDSKIVTTPETEALFNYAKSRFDFEILESLGLCRCANESTIHLGGYEILIEYVHLTLLGIKFLTCTCPEIFVDAQLGDKASVSPAG